MLGLRFFASCRKPIKWTPEEIAAMLGSIARKRPDEKLAMGRLWEDVSKAVPTRTPNQCRAVFDAWVRNESPILAAISSTGLQSDVNDEDILANVRRITQQLRKTKHEIKEDKIIAVLVARFSINFYDGSDDTESKKWELVAEAYNEVFNNGATVKSLKRRSREIHCGDISLNKKHQRSTWSIDESKALIASVLKHTDVTFNEATKRCSAVSGIPWRRIAPLFPRRNYESIRNHWGQGICSKGSKRFVELREFVSETSTFARKLEAPSLLIASEVQVEEGDSGFKETPLLITGASSLRSTDGVVEAPVLSDHFGDVVCFSMYLRGAAFKKMCELVVNTMTPIQVVRSAYLCQLYRGLSSSVLERKAFSLDMNIGFIEEFRAELENLCKPVHHRVLTSTDVDADITTFSFTKLLNDSQMDHLRNVILDNNYGMSCINVQFLYEELTPRSKDPKFSPLEPTAACLKRLTFLQLADGSNFKYPDFPLLTNPIPMDYFQFLKLIPDHTNDQIKNNLMNQPHGYRDNTIALYYFMIQKPLQKAVFEIRRLHPHLKARSLLSKVARQRTLYLETMNQIWSAHPESFPLSPSDFKLPSLSANWMHDKTNIWSLAEEKHLMTEMEANSIDAKVPQISIWREIAHDIGGRHTALECCEKWAKLRQRQLAAKNTEEFANIKHV